MGGSSQAEGSERSIAHQLLDFEGLSQSTIQTNTVSLPMRAV